MPDKDETPNVQRPQDLEAEEDVRGGAPNRPTGGGIVTDDVNQTGGGKEVDGGGIITD